MAYFIFSPCSPILSVNEIPVSRHSCTIVPVCRAPWLMLGGDKVVLGCSECEGWVFLEELTLQCFLFDVQSLEKDLLGLASES